MPVVEIEVDTPTNANLLFGPAGETLRGRLCFLRLRQKEAYEMTQEFPNGIPGQRVGWDADRGEGYLLEPLQEDEHSATRAALERKKLGGFAPARRALTGHGAHGPTVLYWMKRAVDAGLAKVVKGRLPDVIQGEPVKDFIRPQPPKKADDADALRRQELAAKLAMMTAEQRKEYQRLLKELPI